MLDRIDECGDSFSCLNSGKWGFSNQMILDIKKAFICIQNGRKLVKYTYVLDLNTILNQNLNVNNKFTQN